VKFSFPSHSAGDYLGAACVMPVALTFSGRKVTPGLAAFLLAGGLAVLGVSC